MKDIRPPKSSGSKKSPLLPEEESGQSKDLYESSSIHKDTQPTLKKPLASTPQSSDTSLDNKTPKATPAPKKENNLAKLDFTSQPKPSPKIQPKENSLVESPKPAKESKPLKMTGSQVPVTNVHIPKEALQAHSDADHIHTKPERPLFSKAPLQTKKTKSRIGHKERKIVLGLFVLAIAAVGLAAFIFLPKADIHLVLRNAPLLVDEKITIRAQDTTAPDVISGTAFFREIRIEGEAPVTSTEIVGTKASGTVQIVNRTVQEQRIKENSRLVTEDGTLFYMQGPAIVPPASDNSPSSVTVRVIAAEEGEEGNIGPQRLNFAALDRSAQSVVYGQVTTALSGGTGEEVLVIKEEDIQNAQKEAQEEAKNQAEGEIRGELPADWLILEESWDTEVASFEASESIGTRVESFTYTANITVHVMGFEEAKLESTLKNSLSNNLDANYMLFPGPISFTKSIESVDWEQAEAVITARVTHTTVPQLSIETLREKIAGRSEAEAKTYLEGLPGVHEARIELSPFWVNAIPRIEKRVTIEIEAEKKP